MNKYAAQEQAYNNGYELGKKVCQSSFAQQFIRGFNAALKQENRLDNPTLKTSLKGEQNEAGRTSSRLD